MKTPEKDLPPVTVMTEQEYKNRLAKAAPNSISIHGTFYVPPVVVSARPGADDHLKINRKGNPV